ncbi:mannan endo-1,4-beta-mannosidase-like [Physella acuta]|uniref:mannan endo-1,4-beta-mannosidase-like n=1 Tax=Physella acuta TaxID=109671 RepID=UPI0027DC85D8|nr:mannan endo-1,4-beta-mannosidase-like [Physella acuta]
MRLMALVCTLSSALLLVRADVDVPITQHWNGGFQGEACIDITQELHTWTMTLTFDQPINSLNAYQADVTESKDGGKVYVLHNKDWNKDEHVGDKLCVGFQGAATGDIVPKVTASLQGVVGGGTSLTTEAPVTGQTVAPNATFTPGARLKVEGTHFTYNGQRIFLSGGNLPWISYAYDFGEGQWQYRKNQLADQLKKLHEAGGNSMRLWIHIQGETTPAFDSNGFVTGLDTKGTFINDFIDLLNLAQSYNILLTPTLWNGAVNQDNHNRLDGLVKDPAKLQSYIDKALTPWAQAVKGHPALGSWDIMNECEGMLNTDVSDPDPCFDVTPLKNSGAGWAGKKYSYREFLRFYNWQAAAIKAVDPEYLISVGVSNPRFNTDSFGNVDHYSDSCLVKAGGKPEGVMDFYQFHSYSWQGKFDQSAAFVNSAGDYGTTKPIVVGEFWEQDGGGMTTVQMFDWVYNHSYAGAWSWDLMAHGDNQRPAIMHISNYTHNGPIPITVQ